MKSSISNKSNRSSSSGNNSNNYRNSSEISSYYQNSKGDICFDNPLFALKHGSREPSINQDDVLNTKPKSKFRMAIDRRKTQKLNQRHRDFLTTIPAFSDFTDTQLLILEQRAEIRSYQYGDIIFKQGDEGDAFYVLQHGTVEVLVRSDDELSIFQKQSVKKKLNDIGKVVNRLTQGNFFGERALMTQEKRAATIRVDCESATCLVFSRDVYEEVISGNGALIGKDIYKDVDWSKDHETRSLFKHVRSVLDQVTSEELSNSTNAKILYELNTLFTPELSVDEIVARMVITVKNLIKGDRVGLFVLTEDQRSMVLKVSERSKGIRLPIRGLAGSILQSNEKINIADAYLDPRFDSTMDRRFGYRTRQLLGIPVRHPITGDAIGVLQVNNRIDNSIDMFTAEEVHMLEVAAEQLSELLHGRAEIFIQSGESFSQKNFGEGAGNSATILKTSDISNRFSIDINNMVLGSDALKSVSTMGLTLIEVVASVHVALSCLCEPQSVVVGVPIESDRSISPNIHIDSRIFFQIFVQDLPRLILSFINISTSSLYYYYYYYLLSSDHQGSSFESLERKNLIVRRFH